MSTIAAIALTAAIPIAPPIWRLVLISPDATPASARSTPVRPAIVTGTKANPIPAPPSTNAGNRSQKYCPSTGRRVSQATDAAETSSPAVSVGLTPTRPTITWAKLEATTTVSANARTPCRSGRPSSARTSCRYSVSRKNSEKATAPTMAIAMFAPVSVLRPEHPQRQQRRGERSSITTNASRERADNAKQHERRRGAPAVAVAARHRVDEQHQARGDRTQRRRSRSADAGGPRGSRAGAPASARWLRCPTGTLMKKIHDQPRYEVSSPPRRTPAAAPLPEAAP